MELKKHALEVRKMMRVSMMQDPHLYEGRVGMLVEYIGVSI